MKLTINLTNDFTPHIRWMASTATWRMSNGEEQVEVTWQHAVFDLPHLKTGWGIFAEGQAPEWVWDPTLSPTAPAKPADGRDWKRGFKVNVYSENAFGGVREFATTASGACRGLVALVQQFNAQCDGHPGKLPVVEFTGATPVRIGKGSTNVPNFTIVDWVDRPAALAGNGVDGGQAPAANVKDHQAPLASKPDTADPDDPLPYQL